MMNETAAKADLHTYLRAAREAVLWKLDGLSEQEIRRPLTPTGTNLLGLVKHLSTVELLYFGYVFGRHFTEPVPWFSQDAPPNTDLWATAEESRAYILGVHERACAHADATIDALDLDTPGEVEWWADRETTLHRVLVHVIAETHRHAGHADIVRELIDGTAGLQPGNDFLPPFDETEWASHREQVERAARQTSAAEPASRPE
jgi:uncharacterized damage-inducible protein DinB